MKRDLGHKPLRLLTILFFVFLPLVSCSKEESTNEKTPPQQVVNPYTNESVFIEVKKKLEENPDDVDALYHLADLYDRNDQYAEAVDTYKKVVKLKPGIGYAYFKMGTAYDRLNQSAEAVKAFKMTIKLMPKYSVAYNNLGVAYGKLEKYADEITALKKAISLRPNYSSARYNLGMTYLKKGDGKAAMKEYESLKRFDEGAAEALMKEINKAS